jgi:hypothetical protein
MDEAEVVDSHLLFENSAINLLGLTELDRVLNAGIEKNAVNVWVSRCNSGGSDQQPFSTIY